MSELRIALVAEGPTDYVLIEAALKAVLPQPFILTQLQPEATRPDLGQGWSGVLKWCQAASQRHQGPLEQDPTLLGFDLLILHLDVDVSTMAYHDCGPETAALAQQLGWEHLPCAVMCPPVSDTVSALTTVVHSWLRPATTGQQTVLCLPAQSSGTWLAAALLPATHRLLTNTECNLGVENGLAILPKAERVKKNRREYQAKAADLTANWEKVKAICSQAQVFEHDILGAL